jgi:hypothetical protein
MLIDDFLQLIYSESGAENQLQAALRDVVLVCGYWNLWYVASGPQSIILRANDMKELKSKPKS